MEIARHFAASTYIVHKDKVLLHLHKKLGIWIPVGGHIDRNELPEKAALREIKEEAGVTVRLHNPDKQIGVSDVRQLFCPIHILLEDIDQVHQHIDFIYYATSESEKLAPQDGETTNLKWFTAEEVQALEGAPQNVKALSQEAIQLLGKEKK
ncbi:NUDIX domain-containing protein [candidate division WS5 bacterium]|uniref:NUDIX domain-containing protein n=1 Tax=candidate division WS5 bacterium TaxID=2093353 RepID=A0A419DEB9_9BACT|nr:MAG: NUDIX domain-containing protein [candidate division WS5 bacterium]